MKKNEYSIESKEATSYVFDKVYDFRFKKEGRMVSHFTLEVRPRGATGNCQMATIGHSIGLKYLKQDDFNNFIRLFRELPYSKNQILMDIADDDFDEIEKLFINHPDCEVVLKAPYVNKTGRDMLIFIVDINADTIVDEDGEEVDPAFDDYDDYEHCFRRRE